MTREENNKYYQTFLVESGLTNEQIHFLLTKHPIGSTVVRIGDRKEGSLVESKAHHKGEKVLLLYRTDGGWVGVTSYNKIDVIDGKYFTKGYYKFSEPSLDERKKFLQQHFPLQAVQELVRTNASNGELLVATALHKMGFTKAFDVIPEYQIPELIGFEKLWVRSPRYDFAICEKDGKPLMFIEFDGEQHYQADEKFLQTHQRDLAKDAYAFYKHIPLIRIPKGMLSEKDNVDKVAKDIEIFLSAGRFIPQL